MPLSPALAKWLRDQGHDAVHAAEVGLERALDAGIMARASEQGRTIITADLDYPRLLALAGSAQPSLILFREGDWGDTDILSRMNQILSTLGDKDIEQSILVVDRNRIRRRRLPINPEP